MPSQASSRRRRGPKRTISFNGYTYSVRSDKVEIPDLDALSRFAALQWLCRHTYARGYSRPNSLAGLGGAVKVCS